MTFFFCFFHRFLPIPQTNWAGNTQRIDFLVAFSLFCLECQGKPGSVGILRREMMRKETNGVFILNPLEMDKALSVFCRIQEKGLFF